MITTEDLNVDIAEFTKQIIAIQGALQYAENQKRTIDRRAKEAKKAEETAAEEVHEETGYYIESSRLRRHEARQLAGTFSAHKAHLFSAELDEEEIKWFRSQEGIVHGNIEDSERTFIEVYSVQDLIDSNLVDWSTLGMLLQVLSS